MSDRDEFEELGMRWKRDERGYACGRCFMLGRWRVGTVSYDGTAPEGTTENYRASCVLPGVRSDLGHFAKESDAMKMLKAAVEHWVSGAGLQAARRWRPISEAPDDYVVLMCDEHGNRWTGVYPAHDGACGYHATHFQYLPEPPNE